MGRLALLGLSLLLASTAAIAGLKERYAALSDHARPPMAGIQRVIETPRDFKIEKLSGDVKPGGVLSGRISGKLDKTTFLFDFDVNPPAKDAAAGLSCNA